MSRIAAKVVSIHFFLSCFPFLFCIIKVGMINSNPWLRPDNVYIATINIASYIRGALENLQSQNITL